MAESGDSPDRFEMRVNWPWVLAAITIGVLCVAAVVLPFLLAGLAGD